MGMLKYIADKLYSNDKLVMTEDDVDNVNYGIESGSNANGEYTKFPDGTLIMSGKVTLAQQGEHTHVAEATWIHPTTALSGGVTTGNLTTASPSGGDARDYGIPRIEPSTTTSYVNILSASSRDMSTLWGLEYALQFTGRWK